MNKKQKHSLQKKKSAKDSLSTNPDKYNKAIKSPLLNSSSSSKCSCSETPSHGSSSNEISKPAREVKEESIFEDLWKNISLFLSCQCFNIK